MEIVTKKCINCDQVKPVTEFRDKHNQCKQCLAQYAIARVNNNRHCFFLSILNGARQNTRTRLENGRTEAGECTIDVQHIHDLYEKQQGKCYYTNIPMVLQTKSDWKCSLERLDPNKGYIEGNVALVVFEMNVKHQWSKEKFAIFIKKLHTNYVGRIIDPAKQDLSAPARKRIVKTEIDGVMYCKCNGPCGETKPIDKFGVNLGSGCKACAYLAKKRYYETPWGHLKHVLKSMKSGIKNRPASRGLGPPELTHQDLIDILVAQKGLCTYTGIPMTFGSYLDKPWTCSPERIDNAKGYTKDNVCFIIYELNSPRQWSREKVEFLKRHNPLT